LSDRFTGLLLIMNPRLFLSGAGLVLALALPGAPLLFPLAVQEAPRFSAPRVLTNREVALTLKATNGQVYRIDATTNLAAWSPWITVPGAVSLQHTDAAAPYLRQRFYRAQQLADTNALTGDHFVTTNGPLTIKPVNHASFVMSWNGRMIYNDPVGAATLYANYPKADLILVSHDHSDHYNATTLNAVRSAGGHIISPLAVYNNAGMAALRSYTIILGNGGSTDVMGIHLEAIPATNANHQPGIGNGYVLTLGGRRIYISGDTGDIPPMRALTDIDVAFVAMNLPYTMSVASAASAVREFRPKVVYPYHYSPSNPSADLNDFKRRVGQDLGIEVRLRKWY